MVFGGCGKIFGLSFLGALTDVKKFLLIFLWVVLGNLCWFVTL
jgi:hypothetical protein